MTVTEKDLDVIGMLLEQKLEPVRAEMNNLRAEMNESFEALFRWYEKREQEHLFGNEQLRRLEDKVDKHDKATAALQENAR